MMNLRKRSVIRLLRRSYAEVHMLGANHLKKRLAIGNVASVTKLVSCVIFHNERNTPLDKNILYMKDTGFTRAETQKRIKIGGILSEPASFVKSTL